MRKILFAGIELTSQRVRGLQGTSELPGRPACIHPIISRLYMDGWRDGLNRLWWDGVTILRRPAKKIATAKTTVPSRPSKKKQKTPPRPVPSKKKKSHPVPPRKKKPTAPSRLGKNKPRLVPPRKNKQTAPSRHEQQNTPPRGWKLETNTTACPFFSLSCCTFISFIGFL